MKLICDCGEENNVINTIEGAKTDNSNLTISLSIDQSVDIRCKRCGLELSYRKYKEGQNK